MRDKEILRNIFDEFYSNKILWTKDSRKKTKLLKHREAIWQDDKILIKEAEKWRDFFDIKIKNINRNEKNEEINK